MFPDNDNYLHWYDGPATWRHWPQVVLAFLLAILFVFALGAITKTGRIAGSAHVIDGDTLDVGGHRIRVFGIDAPEKAQKCNGANGTDWACGKAATRELASLVTGKRIACAVKNPDQYDRLIALCRDGAMDIGAEMVRRGMAWAFIKYETPYVSLEARPRAMGIGIWQAPTMTPWEFRKKRWHVEAQLAPKGCPIKGNINRYGEHIYHVPWSRDYDRTRVSPEKGERWFCDEGQALRAGWRPPKPVSLHTGETQ